MPFFRNEDISLHYLERGQGEPLMLIHGLGCSGAAWAFQVAALEKRFRVIVPDLPSVPVQPLLQEGSNEYGMFEHFRRYPWVLTPYRYRSQEELITDLVECVIRPAG